MEIETTKVYLNLLELCFNSMALVLVFTPFITLLLTEKSIVQHTECVIYN